MAGDPGLRTACARNLGERPDFRSVFSSRGLRGWISRETARVASADEGLPKALDLLLSMFGRARVVNNEIGKGAFGVQGILGRLPGRKIPFRPAPAQSPGQADLTGASIKA